MSKVDFYQKDVFVKKIFNFMSDLKGPFKLSNTKEIIKQIPEEFFEDENNIVSEFVKDRI